MQNQKFNRVLSASLSLGSVGLLSALTVACNPATPSPVNCTPLSQAPAPFAGTTFPAGNTTLGLLIAQGAGNRAAISVESVPPSNTPITFSTQLWDGSKWTNASMGQVVGAANVPQQVYAGNDWVAMGTIQTSSTSDETAVFWDQVNSTSYSTPNTFPGLPVNVYSQPVSIGVSPVDQHVGVAIVDYTANQIYLAERSASGSDSSWTASQIMIGGVALTGLPVSLVYDSNNLPWVLVKSNGSSNFTLTINYRDGSNNWHQLPVLSSTNLAAIDQGYAVMESPSNSQIMVVWTEQQSASTSTQYVGNVFGSFVDTTAKVASPPAALASNVTDTTSSSSSTPGFNVLVAASNDGERGMVELWGYQSHQLWYGAVSQDQNGNSQFLPLELQTEAPTLPPWIFYDQCGDIASALVPGTAPDYAAGTTIEELSGY